MYNMVFTLADYIATQIKSDFVPRVGDTVELKMRKWDGKHWKVEQAGGTVEHINVAYYDDGTLTTIDVALV